MAISKIVYKSSPNATPVTWMDVTQKTVTSGTMLNGTTALKNDGTDITGNIASKTSSNLSASGATVTAEAGYYASSASKTVASGTEGTPAATKGTVSNHAVSVTPSVTNTAGYISGGTKTGTAVSVSASELVSGTYTVSASGTADVTNYASISVPAMTLPSASSSTSSGTSKATITPGSSAQYLNIPTGFNPTAQFYTIAAGGGGGSGITTETGSFTGNGTHTISFAVTKVPDIVVVYRSDLQNPTAVSDRAHAASLFYAGVIGASIYTAASSTTYANSGSAKNDGVHDGTGIANNMVGYYNGYLYVRSGNNSNLWSTSLTYDYILYFFP